MGSFSPGSAGLHLESLSGWTAGRSLAESPTGSPLPKAPEAPKTSRRGASQPAERPASAQAAQAGETSGRGGQCRNSAEPSAEVGGGRAAAGERELGLEQFRFVSVSGSSTLVPAAADVTAATAGAGAGHGGPAGRAPGGRQPEADGTDMASLERTALQRIDGLQRRLEALMGEQGPGSRPLAKPRQGGGLGTFSEGPNGNAPAWGDSWGGATAGEKKSAGDGRRRGEEGGGKESSTTAATATAVQRASFLSGVAYAQQASAAHAVAAATATAAEAARRGRPSRELAGAGNAADTAVVPRPYEWGPFRGPGSEVDTPAGVRRRLVLAASEDGSRSSAAPSRADPQEQISEADFESEEERLMRDLWAFAAKSAGLKGVSGGYKLSAAAAVGPKGPPGSRPQRSEKHQPHLALAAMPLHDLATKGAPGRRSRPRTQPLQPRRPEEPVSVDVSTGGGTRKRDVIDWGAFVDPVGSATPVVGRS